MANNMQEGRSIAMRNIFSHLHDLTRIAAVMAAIMVSTAADGLEPVSLPPAEAVVAFVVTGNGEELPVTVPELEALGLYQVTTESPWEEGDLTFQGVLFSDVVAYLGLGDATSLRIRALDDYAQEVPREDWVDKPLILATRQDGEPLTRRTQGPSRLVYPLSEYPGYEPTVQDDRWVWLIKRIERAD
jgi:hypothetical protein